jgi:hypothetical protein
MRIFLVLFLPISLVLGNVYIYFTTKKKIEAYAKIPPFRTEDYTVSNKIDKSSELINLKDKNPDTHWKKLRDSRYKKYDAELEYTLTHEWKENQLVPKQFNSLRIILCKEDKPKDLDIDIFLREAINIDKDLRLPDSFFYKSYHFSEELKNEIIQKDFELKNLSISSEFPKNIFIITLFLKTSSPKSCISDIYFE